jgi:hypothetical protein
MNALLNAHVGGRLVAIIAGNKRAFEDQGNGLP